MVGYQERARRSTGALEVPICWRCYPVTRPVEKFSPDDDGQLPGVLFLGSHRLISRLSPTGRHSGTLFRLLLARSLLVDRIGFFGLRRNVAWAFLRLTI